MLDFVIALIGWSECILINLLNFVAGHGFSERSDKALNDYKKLLLKESKSLTEWSKKLQKIYEEENSDEENEAASEKTSVQKLALFEISVIFSLCRA